VNLKAMQVMEGMATGNGSKKMIQNSILMTSMLILTLTMSFKLYTFTTTTRLMFLQRLRPVPYFVKFLNYLKVRTRKIQCTGSLSKSWKTRSTNAQHFGCLF